MTIAIDLEQKFNVLKQALKGAYAPYSKKKEACLIRYYNEAGDKQSVIGVTLENCAYPNTISAVQSAVVNLRHEVPHNTSIEVKYVCMLERPSLGCLSLLHEIVPFHVDGPKIFFSDGTSYPSDKDVKSSLFSMMPKATMNKPFKFPNRQPTDYKAMTYAGKEPLTKCEEALVASAIEGMNHSYPVNSNFAVGASFQVSFSDGTVETFNGGNIEPAHFGDGLCAERVGLCRIINELATRETGPEAVKVERGCCVLFSDAPASPCGSCRQNLSEWGNYPMLLLECDYDHKTYKIHRWSTVSPLDENMKCILPMAFTPKDLGMSESPLNP